MTTTETTNETPAAAPPKSAARTAAKPAGKPRETFAAPPAGGTFVDGVHVDEAPGHLAHIVLDDEKGA